MTIPGRPTPLPAYVHSLRAAWVPSSIGNKAANLRFLVRQGVTVPDALVCTWEAYLDYRVDGPSTLARLRSQLEPLLRPNLRYAVRSSANVEDGIDHSFAGQFKTVLDLEGADEVLRAIEMVWNAAESPGVRAYLARHDIPIERLRMAVLVQEMVFPHVSGVSFSRNPMTGLNEVIVEAVPGSGEALVQEGRTPTRWIQKWGTWTLKPEAGTVFAAAAQDQDDGLGLAIVEEIIRQTKAIAKAFGRPVDLEWVYDGRSLNWVQLRQITALNIPVYSNRISREVLPGIIKPLIWSVNAPLVNGAWVRLLTELIGPNRIDPLSLAGHYYYRAYFNITALGEVFELLGLPRETLELLLGLEVEGPEKPSFRPTARTLARLPSMIRFVLHKLGFSRALTRHLPALQRKFDDLYTVDVANLSEAELLDAIDRLFVVVQETAYYNIVAPVLMALYSQALRGRLRGMGIDFESVDLTSGMVELLQFEPAAHLAPLSDQYRALAPDLLERLAQGGVQELRQLPEAASLQQGIDRFLEQFGHLSDSGNDFSAIPWRERPDTVLALVAGYQPAEAQAAPKVRFEDLNIAAPRRWLLQPLVRRARRYRLHREAVSSVYTYGYGLFRIYFLALGERLARRGILRSREDIFYLYFPEVRGLVGNPNPNQPLQAVIDQRKAEIEGVRDAPLPEILYGSQPPPMTDAGNRTQLRGIPTSRGLHRGPAKVLHGIEEWARLEAGDVLIVPYSDVGWTPLFVRAGAVVAESGGMLSHSSIIAREYNIPAVVSVAGACRIADGTMVTVDGYRGEITIHMGE